MDLRYTPALHVKLAGAGEGVISGYASTFGGLPDAYGDTIAAGAFSKSLAEHQARGTLPAMLWAHKSDRPIGKWTEMREDRRGLFAVGQLNLNTEAGREAHSHVKEGDVTGLSIGFTLAKDGVVFNADGTTTLTEVNLHEVSAVAVPANPSARITGVKSINNKREFEEALRDMGFPKAAAVKLAAHGWSGLDPDTADDDFDALLRAVKSSTLRIRNA